MSFSRIISFEVILFLGGLAAIIAYRLLTGGINTQYLLYGKRKNGTRYLSPERVQLLLFTLGTAMFYVVDVLEKRSTCVLGDLDTCVLPDIPAKTLALLGGSHAIYLGGKAYTMLSTKIKGE